MNTTEKIQTYLNDPKIVSVNTVDTQIISILNLLQNFLKGR